MVQAPCQKRSPACSEVACVSMPSRAFPGTDLPLRYTTALLYILLGLHAECFEQSQLLQILL